MTDTIETLLYAPPRLAKPPAKQWRAADFRDVDDRVRGGSSTSKMTIVSHKTDAEERSQATNEKSVYAAAEVDRWQDGEIIFDGFLGE